MFLAIWPTRAAFCKRTATRVIPSFMNPNRVARRAYAKPPVGHTRGVTSMIFGPRPNPRSPKRRLIGSVSSMTLSAISTANPPTSAMPRGKN